MNESVQESNAGNLDIATGDDGNESIYFRQYKNGQTSTDNYGNYASGTPTRTLTSLEITHEYIEYKLVKQRPPRAHCLAKERILKPAEKQLSRATGDQA